MKNLTKLLIRKMLLLMPVKIISQYVFIVGCGRSGTTILGTALSKHSKITYLNERRDLWFSAYPESDIWTHKAIERNGKLVLTAENTDAGKSKKLRNLFRMEALKTRKPILIEKLPINNFRLDFINSIFPNAKYIHIYRNGLEVARSIEKQADAGKWFGSNDYKWKQLVNISKQNHTHPLSELCSGNYEKGLLEWRFSTEAVVNFLKDQPHDKFLEFSYDDLTSDPVSAIQNVLDFIGIDDEPGINNFAEENISRRSKKISTKSYSEKEKIIGGDFLRASMMNDDEKGLTQYFLEENGLHK